MTAANEVRTLPQRCPSTLLILFVSASTKLEGAWNEPRTPLLPDNRVSHSTNTKFITLTTVQLPGNGSSMFELNPFTGHSYKVKFIDPRRSVKMLPEFGRKERGEIYVKCWKWNPGKFFFLVEGWKNSLTVAWSGGGKAKHITSRKSKCCQNLDLASQPTALGSNRSSGAYRWQLWLQMTLTNLC